MTTQMCTCCDCGYQWVRGQHGGHSCTETFQKTIGKLILENKRLKRDHGAGDSATIKDKSIAVEITKNNYDDIVKICDYVVDTLPLIVKEKKPAIEDAVNSLFNIILNFEDITGVS